MQRRFETPSLIFRCHLLLGLPLNLVVQRLEGFGGNHWIGLEVRLLSALGLDRPVPGRREHHDDSSLSFAIRPQLAPISASKLRVLSTLEVKRIVSGSNHCGALTFPKTSADPLRHMGIAV